MRTASVFSVLFTCLLLAGCTNADWAGTLNTLGLDDTPAPVEAPAAPPPPTQAAATLPGSLDPSPGDPAFCQAVARQDADGNGFDAPTRQRVYQARLAQCQAMFANPVASAPSGNETR